MKVQTFLLDSLIETFSVFYQDHGLDHLDKSDQKSEQRSGLRDGEMDSVYYYESALHCTILELDLLRT